MKYITRQVVRKLLILLFAWALGWLLMIVFFGWLACTEVNKQIKPYDTLVTHASLTGKAAITFPFKDFPASHATNIIIFDRSLGVVGFETWTSFRLKNAADFDAYLKSLQTSPTLRKIDHVLAWGDEKRSSGLPVRLRRHWALTDVTTGTRVSAQDGYFRQWIFDPARNRVLTVTADLPALTE